MSYAHIYSRANQGIAAPPIEVEVHLLNGMPTFSIIGLPETAVKESKDRVRCAIRNAGFELPDTRIIVNLAPAELPKQGSHYDLPIAIGILVASQQLPDVSLDDIEFTGELALNGNIKPIQGTLPFAIRACDAKRMLVVPEENASEAALHPDAHIIAAKHLLDATNLFFLKQRGEDCPRQPPTPHETVRDSPINITDVVGQQQGKRGLLIAASGGHSLLLSGPPGTGKTMLASRLPTLLPRLNTNDATACAAIYSLCQSGFKSAYWGVRPFRAPHHSASLGALIGGGNPPKPGEVSRAHHGVLFLDELPEFKRHVLEALREPLETGTITISRAAYQCEFPAAFQLIAAMNPCPCGHWGDTRKQCRCTPDQIQRYQHKISGPFLDRIDCHVVMAAAGNHFDTPQQDTEPTSNTYCEQATAARDRQLARQGVLNAQLSPSQLQTHCRLSPENHQLLEASVQKLRCSLRAMHRLLKVARTLADIEACEHIAQKHLLEALHFRPGFHRE